MLCQHSLHAPGIANASLKWSNRVFVNPDTKGTSHELPHMNGLPIARNQRL